MSDTTIIAGIAIAAAVLIALAARWYSAQLDKLDELVDESGEHL